MRVPLIPAYSHFVPLNFPRDKIFPSPAIQIRKLNHLLSRSTGSFHLVGFVSSYPCTCDNWAGSYLLCSSSFSSFALFKIPFLCRIYPLMHSNFTFLPNNSELPARISGSTQFEQNKYKFFSEPILKFGQSARCFLKSKNKPHLKTLPRFLSISSSRLLR
jgi:hypothetical protein